MKLAICFLLTMAAIAAPKRLEKKSAPPAAVSIPPEATEVAPNTFQYLDPQGRTWIYRRTPFGVSKSEDKPASADALKAEAKVLEETTAREDGDSIRFERPGPFGRYSWSRKKTELNESEQKVWDRERTKTAKQE